jgi:hypothetical protein
MGRQPFCKIGEVLFETASIACRSAPTTTSADEFVVVKRSLTARTPLSTLEQSPERRRYGCDPAE